MQDPLACTTPAPAAQRRALAQPQAKPHAGPFISNKLLRAHGASPLQDPLASTAPAPTAQPTPERSLRHSLTQDLSSHAGPFILNKRLRADGAIDVQNPLASTAPAPAAQPTARAQPQAQPQAQPHAQPETQPHATAQPADLSQPEQLQVQLRVQALEREVARLEAQLEATCASFAAKEAAWQTEKMTMLRIMDQVPRGWTAPPAVCTALKHVLSRLPAGHEEVMDDGRGAQACSAWRVARAQSGQYLCSHANLQAESALMLRSATCSKPELNFLLSQC